MSAAPADAVAAADADADASGAADVIAVQGLTKRYGDKTVVDGLDMRVRRGEIFGFLGPNGSGKTTSIRMLCGLPTPDAGTGRTLGFDIVREPAQIKRRVGYMTQRFGLYDDLTIRENLDFIARMYAMDRRRERVDQALARLGLVERSPPACCTSRNCCCSTSPRPVSTRRRAALSGKRSTAWPSRA